MNEPSDWVFWPSGWIKHLTQLLVELYLTQHFLECRIYLNSSTVLDMGVIANIAYCKCKSVEGGFCYVHSPRRLSIDKKL